MATRIIHRRGKGIPKASDFASVGEILIDTDTGTGYTLREPDGAVVALGGDGSSGGSGAGMVISETEPADPETGLQWLEASTGRVWIWDEDKWLEFPAAVPEVESGAPAVHVGDTAPADPVEGQQWFNTDNGTLYIYYDNNGNPEWVSASGGSSSGAPAVHVGDTAPADPVEGQQWLNTDDGYLYVYYDNAGDPTWMAVEREGGSDSDTGGQQRC